MLPNVEISFTVSKVFCEKVDKFLITACGSQENYTRTRTLILWASMVTNKRSEIYDL